MKCRQIYHTWLVWRDNDVIWKFIGQWWCPDETLKHSQTYEGVDVHIITTQRNRRIPKNHGHGHSHTSKDLHPTSSARGTSYHLGFETCKPSWCWWKKHGDGPERRAMTIHDHQHFGNGAVWTRRGWGYRHPFIVRLAPFGRSRLHEPALKWLEVSLTSQDESLKHGTTAHIGHQYIYIYTYSWWLNQPNWKICSWKWHQPPTVSRKKMTNLLETEITTTRSTWSSKHILA